MATAPSARAQEFARPTGLYALGNVGQAPSESVIELPFVNGWAMRTAWTLLEPSPGVYDFSSIDSTIAALQAKNKGVTLIVFAKEVPSHLLAGLPAEERYFAIGPQGTDLETAVTWSNAALQRQEALALALANHLVLDASTGLMVPFRDHPTLRQVDCSILGLAGVRDIGSRLVSTPTYDRNTFVTATVRSINAVDDQFPNKFTYTAFFRMNDSIVTPPLDEHLLDVFRAEWFDGSGTPRLGLFQETLACNTPGTQFAFAMFEEQNNTYTMFQMLQSWVNPFANPAQTDPCLVTTVPGDRDTAISGPEVGIQYAFQTFGCRYFEVYVADLTHDGFADEFQIWHDTLTVGPSVPAVSSWGLVSMVLLVITVGTLALRRRARSKVATTLLVLVYTEAGWADCTLTSTGKTPLNDLGAATYLGAMGGLYPNGTNIRPSAHYLRDEAVPTEPIRRR